MNLSFLTESSGLFTIAKHGTKMNNKGKLLSLFERSYKITIIFCSMELVWFTYDENIENSF